MCFVALVQSYKEQKEEPLKCTQTGFRQHPIGLLLYACCAVTLIGLQIVMLLLVMCYYFIEDVDQIKEDSPKLSLAWNPFEDPDESIVAFEVAWGVAFAWVLIFKRPDSIYAAFLRRCDMRDATHVAVFVPDTTEARILSEDVKNTLLSKISNAVFVSFESAMTLFYSEPNRGVAGKTSFVPVQTDYTNAKFIEFRLRRYHFDAKSVSFAPSDMDISGSAAKLYEMRGGLSSEKVREKEAEVGLNVINIGDPSFIGVVISEFSKIFYVYQNFMAWTWFNFFYWHMGIVNTLVYVSGGLVVSYVKYRNDCRLKELSKISGTVNVLRDGKFVEIEQKEIVPGDVISLGPGVTYCDMAILTGEVLVDESSLTGEAMPIVKTAMDTTNPVPYNAVHHHKHHSVFAGTTIISDAEETDESRHKNLALVIRTGSHTMKGELLRDILFGDPKLFKFDVEVNTVLLILLCYAIFAFSITLYFLNSDATYGFFYAIYCVGSALPPLLPTVFIVSEGISADRLFAKKVVVSDSHRILMAGKVRVAFFDKTGTLTAQGLDFLNVVTVANQKFSKPDVEPYGDILQAMSVCHSVKKVSQNGAEVFIGSSLDRKMFETTGCSMINGLGKVPDRITSQDGVTFSILKQFDFDSKRKTQSVIVRNETNGKLFVYTKGTGENIKRICIPSGVPSDFDTMITKSARSGLYQISISFREAADQDVLQLPRDEVERNMNLLGFINFTNKMKEETPGMLKQLREGDIRSVMISGDHVLTALHIARVSGMVHSESRIFLGKNVNSKGEIEWVDEATDSPVVAPSVEVLRSKGNDIELALSGHVWEHLITKTPHEARVLAHFVRVIGRCSPGDKISIVDCFNKQGFITLMCGDGGNDCGALRTAHVGIALSDSEASVVSPFTSVEKDITSVVEVLKEGRCTLASAIASYKYMIMYGQVETFLQIIAAWFSVTLSEWCWVFMDGFWVITMAFSLPFANVAENLAPERPTSSILGPRTLASALGVLAINFGFICLALGILFEQPWFQCRKWKEGAIDDVTIIGDNYESTVLFIVMGAQYVSSAFPFNFGFLHRANWFYNWRFVLFVIAWIIIHFIVTLHPSKLSCFFRVNCDNDDVVRFATSSDKVPIQNSWGTTVMPPYFRGILIIIIVSNAVALMLWEYVFVEGAVAKWIKSFFPKQDKLLGGVGYKGSNRAPSGDGESTSSNIELTVGKFDSSDNSRAVAPSQENI